MIVGQRINQTFQADCEGRFERVRHADEEILALVRAAVVGGTAQTELAITDERIVEVPTTQVPVPRLDSKLTAVLHAQLSAKKFLKPSQVVVTALDEPFSLEPLSPVDGPLIVDAISKAIDRGAARRVAAQDLAAGPFEEESSLSLQFPLERRLRVAHMISGDLEHPEMFGNGMKVEAPDGRDLLITTTMRLLPLADGQPIELNVAGQIWFQQIQQVDVVDGESGRTLEVATANGKSIFGPFPDPLEAHVAKGSIEFLADLYAPTDEQVNEALETLSEQERFDAVVFGKPTAQSLAEVRASTRAGETPEFVLGVGMNGTLAAFGDRCMLVKKGGGAGLMSGSIGGGRTTTFMYGQVTGIEYNSGLLQGVLEILTPSYPGGQNADFWTGTFQARNKAKNDPFVLPNTLPLDRVTYEQHRALFDRLRELVATHGTAPAGLAAQTAVSAETTRTLAEEIADLRDLHASGALDDDEFRQAKQATIQKHAG